MGNREIKGMTITSNNEHIDSEGHHRCNTCDTKTLLVTAPCEWEIDEEPYKSGENSAEELPDSVFVGEVSGHWCSKCEMLVSLSYNYS